MVCSSLTIPCKFFSVSESVLSGDSWPEECQQLFDFTGEGAGSIEGIYDSFFFLCNSDEPDSRYRVNFPSRLSRDSAG